MAKTVYKKKVKNGTEYYFYRLRHKNLKNPKDIYAKTVKELESKINKIKNNLDYGIENNKEYFENFFTNWLFNVKFTTLKPSTKEKYEGLYRNYIKNSSLSKIYVKNLTLNDIQDYYKNILNAGASPNCIANINKLIAPCIRYAYNNNLIIKDFSKAIILPKESETDKLSKKNKIIPFTLDEQKRFIAAIKGDEYEMLYITALNTGMRQGELFALTWSDVDLTNGYININKTAKNVSDVSRDGRKKATMRIQTPKTINSIRKIKIPNFLISLLKTYKLKQKEHKLKLADLYKDKNLVFANAYGNYLDSSNIRKRMNKIIDTMNSKDKDHYIEPRKFHDLRHTYATRLFELGEEPKTVQELLGHSDVSVTLNTYTHVLDDIKDKAISKLDNLCKTMGQI